MIPQNEQETALVIDHGGKTFHISSTRPAIMRRLRKLAGKYNLAIDNPADVECVSLTGVRTKYLRATGLVGGTNQ